MKKRILTIALAIIMCASLFTVSALAEYDNPSFEATGTVFKFTGSHPVAGEIDSVGLRLDSPLSIEFSWGSQSVSEIQLGISSDSALSSLEPFIGKKVTITGYAFEAHTQWHFRDLIVLVETLDEYSLPGNVPSDWAKAEVEAAIDAGLVPAGLRDNYRAGVSRGSTAQMFINLIEKCSGASIDAIMAAWGISIDYDAFTDTTDKAVLAANALGIINGVGDNKFDPEGSFTRSQIAAIINRVARLSGEDTEGYTHSFTDVKGHWSSAELGWPTHAGVIKGAGDNTFNPEGVLSTEQAIAITYRAYLALS